MLRAYGAAGWLAAPWLRRMLAKRVVRAKEIPARLNERYGIASAPRPAGRLIWFHAASVGETMSVLPVIAALVGRAEVLLTTGTVTSAALAAERLPPNARHQFVPLDVPGWCSAFLDHWRPDGAVFVESELWPTMLRLIDARGIPRLLINARMSARSAARWRLLPGLAARLIGAFRRVHAQSSQDARNLEALGAVDVLDWGNLKYAAPALPAEEGQLAALRLAVPGPVWLAASTHQGEEAVVIAAHERLLKDFPDLITIIVPRHPERGAEFLLPRRSLGQQPEAGAVYIADTLGELGLFYRLAPFAFVGGSLVRHGGQNVIEPARLGRAGITGPHVWNFAGPVAVLKAAGALLEVTDALSLAESVRVWLRAPEAARNAGVAAAGCFEGLEDLPEKIASLILAASL
jgi:3-deoxy-D-manno-octulosonic-acid transferase